MPLIATRAGGSARGYGFTTGGSALSLLAGSIYTYVYSGAAVGSITELESTIATLLPAYGYLRYKIKMNSGSRTITVPFRKNGTQLCQSAFKMSSWGIGSTNTIYNWNNDDQDTTVMTGDGYGVNSRGNENNWSSNYEWYKENVNYGDGVSLETALGSGIGNQIAGNYGTVIAFPQTNATMVYVQNTGYYRINVAGTDKGAFSIPSEIASLIGTAQSTNSLMTLSDGVNCFLIYRWGASSAYYIEMDLNTGQMLRYSSIPYSAGQNNGTEEDSNGTQLFAVNARSSFHAGGAFYWTPLSSSTTGWRWAGGLATDTSNSFGSSTQSDMDVFGSIGSDNYVWFADWGHDDGGIFGVGNDSTLGTAKTNVYLTPSTYSE